MFYFYKSQISYSEKFSHCLHAASLFDVIKFEWIYLYMSAINCFQFPNQVPTNIETLSVVSMGQASVQSGSKRVKVTVYPMFICTWTVWKSKRGELLPFQVLCVQLSF